MSSVERGAGLPAPPVLHELADYLERTGSILSPDEALGHAVREWIASREGEEVARDVGTATAWRLPMEIPVPCPR